MPMHRKHWISCPDCRKRLPRNSEAIQQHYRDAHQKALSQADAYKIASPQKKGRAPYAEGLSRIWQEVQGGLPGLGKKK